MPTSGSAEKKLPSGNRPRPRKAKRCARIATSEPGAAADRIADQHAANEGLDEVRAERRQRCRKSGSRRTRRRQQHRRHAEAAHRDFPEIEHDRAEQQRHQQIDEPPPLGPDRTLAARLITHDRRREPGRDHDHPEADCAPIRQCRDRAAGPARWPRPGSRRPMPIAGARSSAIQAASTNSTPAPATVGHIGCDSSDVACGASGSRNASASAPAESSKAEPKFARIHQCAPIRRATPRSIRPTIAIRPEDSTAEATSAAQSCTVCP